MGVVARRNKRKNIRNIHLCDSPRQVLQVHVRRKVVPQLRACIEGLGGYDQDLDSTRSD